MPPTPIHIRSGRRSYSQPLLPALSKHEPISVRCSNPPRPYRSRSYSPPLQQLRHEVVPRDAVRAPQNNPPPEQKPPAADVRQPTPDPGAAGTLTMPSTLGLATSSPQLTSNVPQIVVPPTAARLAMPHLFPNATPAQSRGNSPGQHGSNAQKTTAVAPCAISPKLTSRVTWTPVSSPQLSTRVLPTRTSLSPAPVQFTSSPRATIEGFAGSQRIMTGPMRYVQYSVMPGVPGAAPNVSRPSPAGWTASQFRSP